MPHYLSPNGSFSVQLDDGFDLGPEWIARKGADAALFVQPHEGQIKNRAVILYTTNPPGKLFVRRVREAKFGRLVLEDTGETIEERDIIILGRVCMWTEYYNASFRI